MVKIDNSIEELYKDIIELSNLTNQNEIKLKIIKMNVEHIENKLNTILDCIYKKKCNNEELNINMINSYINNLMEFSLFVRDKDYGLGSQIIFFIFMKCFVYYSFDVTLINKRNIELLFEKIIKTQYNKENNKYYSIGSWKDLKQFANYLKKNNVEIHHPIFNIIFNRLCKQIKYDYLLYENGEYGKISLCTKWMPREKSKYNWMVYHIVRKLFTNNPNQHFFSMLKEYRIILSTLNKCLDTTEIHLCSNKWSNIKFNNINNSTLNLYSNKFYNNLENKFISDDKRLCSKNFMSFKQKQFYVIDENNSINNTREFIKDTLANTDNIKSFTNIINKNKNNLFNGWDITYIFTYF